MSRSRKKTPYHGIAGTSDKKDKRCANRALRRAVHAALDVDPEGIVPQVREVSDPWSFSKDGKKYFEPARFPELMRK